MPVSQEFARGTRTKESKHACKFLAIFTRLDPTAMGGELWIACLGTGVSTGGRAHVCASFSARVLGYVHDGQPTVILQVSFQIRQKKRERKEKTATL